MRRSLRLKLLALYSFIALTMATVFGGTTYYNVRHATLGAVDSRLLELTEALASVLIVNDDGSFYLELSDPQLDLFQRDREQALYYRIWNDRGGEVDSSHPTYDVPPLLSSDRRTRGSNREVANHGPAGSRILVGQGIRSELRQLNNLAATTVIVGFVVLVAMLGGGWYLIGRALEPINRITAAAAMISESRLSERIEITAMESELSNLARTINNAFDRLQQAIERQTRFTADASHELRTPLTVILVHADRALKSLRSPAEYQEVLQAVQKSAKRMQAVVEGLLTLARRDSPHAQEVMEALWLNQLVEETCQLHQHLADLKLIDLQQNLSPIRVFGNRVLLSEAIGNLLGNAIKFAPFQGQVVLSLKTEAETAVLTVSDNGPGITAADRPFVFDRFFRAGQARTSGAGSGIGLGLAITKSIVETHGGEVVVASQEGAGAALSIRLKILHQPPASGPVAARQ